MDLDSATTLLAAWVLVPLLVALLSAGLGLGTMLISGLELGALTLPTGFLAGIALVSAALELGAGPVVTVVLCVALAAAGPAYLAVRARSGPRERRRPRIPHATVWAGGAALVAYAIGIAPLVASGHSGVLGYVLNNDSAVHIELVKSLSQHGAHAFHPGSDSFLNATSTFSGGYPIGSYAWPMVGTLLTGTEPFHTWSPLIALGMGMVALVVYEILRRLGGAPAFAAIAGTLAAVSYIPYSYLAQSGAKELILPVAVIGAVALAVRALEREHVGWRALIPAAMGTAAAIADMGVGALAWLGPAGLVVLGWLLVRALRSRSAAGFRQVGIYALAAGLVALPSATASIAFFRSSSNKLTDPSSIGNLLGPVPLRETLGIWFANDYRIPAPDFPAPTWVATILAGGFAIAGIVYAVRRRSTTLPLALFAAGVGAALLYSRVSDYFAAKSLVLLGVVLAAAAAAGVLWLWRSAGAARMVGALAGALLAVGVLASAALVYSGMWITPKDRFEQLAEIGDRFAGRGPMLVNDREYYADYFLRGAQPWNDWSERQPMRGVRTRAPDGVAFPPGLPHAPDFDDYRWQYFGRFRLLLDSKRPGGSHPPGNFRPVFETPSYRVWERTGPSPRMHLALGLAKLSGSGPLDGAARLRCDSPQVRRLATVARHTGSPIVVSLPGRAPRTIVPANAWVGYGGAALAAPASTIIRRRGHAARSAVLPPGRYAAYLQGSYARGVQLSVDGRRLGSIHEDLGLPSEWHLLGRFDAQGRRQGFVLRPLEIAWWRPGTRRAEVTGPLVVVAAGDEGRVERIPVGKLSAFCGKRVDWLELPAGATPLPAARSKVTRP